jgi:predicted CXXCH cytochrome family protein
MTPTYRERTAGCHDAHGGPDLGKALVHAVRHEPYAKGKCNSCHAPNVPQKKKELIKQVPQLCWDCHKQGKKGFEGKVQHSPVFTGRQCLECHSTHASFAKKLLYKSSPKLCFNCHDKELFGKTYKHRALRKVAKPAISRIQRTSRNC